MCKDAKASACAGRIAAEGLNFAAADVYLAISGIEPVASFPRTADGLNFAAGDFHFSLCIDAKASVTCRRAAFAGDISGAGDCKVAFRINAEASPARRAAGGGDCAARDDHIAIICIDAAASRRCITAGHIERAGALDSQGAIGVNAVTIFRR